MAEAGSGDRAVLLKRLLELKSKLGPVLWQMAPTKKFEPEDFGAFLAFCRQRVEGRAIRHVVEVRHESFVTPDFIELLRKHSVAVVLVDSPSIRLIADVTSDFVYGRLQRTEERQKTGYPPDALDTWAKRAKAVGGRRRTRRPCDHLRQGYAPRRSATSFVYMISGAKVRAPAAAMALIERL